MLASEIVESLFRRLSTRYGSGWTSKWAGLPAEDVAADWSRVLGNLDTEAIRYALEYLPEFVPTAHQFREIARRAPLPQHVSLPAPKPTEEEKARVRAMLAGVRAKLTRRAA